MEVRFLSEAEIRNNMDLIQDLNPEIPMQVLQQRLEIQLKEGYSCVGLFEDSACMAIANIRMGTRFFCGKYADIDSVIVRAEYRSRGLGKKLMDWFHRYALEQNCDVAVLDAYVENESANKFYGREGYIRKGYHHVKVLNPDSPVGCHH